MIAPPALPSLPGLAWSRHKKPGFSTRVASHVSGREVRVALMSSPLYEFEAVYSGLASSSAAAFAGLGSTSLQSLMGFFLQLLGQAGTFLYTDPDDGSVAGQFVAVGDGVTQSFILSRTLGGFNEPVAWVSNVANVYLNGVAQPSNSWIFTAPNSIGFYTAPASSVAVTADFSYAFQCRFLDDQMDFEEFMSSLWKLDSMKFRSIKANIAAAPAPAWYSRYAIGGVLPALFADTATEASADHYYYNGSTYSGFAALLAACGMTFSRASSATYTNSSGQVATAGAGTLRFDYSSGGAPLGILLEGASTNLQNYSSGNFAVGGFWTGTANYTITDNAVTGPDGLTSASSVYPNSTSSASFYQFGAATIAYASGTTYTHAWYFKYAGNRYIQLWANENVSLAYANFDLQAGTLGSYANVVSTPLIQPLGSGWYRCVMTVSANQNGLNGAGYGLVGSSSATRLQAFAPGSTSKRHLRIRRAGGSAPVCLFLYSDNDRQRDAGGGRLHCCSVAGPCHRHALCQSRYRL